MIKTITQEGLRVDIAHLDAEINAMDGWKVLEVATKFINWEVPATETTHGFSFIDPAGWIVRLVTLISIDN